MKTLILTAALILMIGCKKEPKEGNVTFYQIDFGSARLVVDSQDKGILGSSQQMPVCGDNVQNKIRTIKLSYGEHKYWLEDLDGVKISKVFYLNLQKDCMQQKVEL